MKINEVIKNRRAVFPRQYNLEPVSREEIELILSSANWAPTHKRTEPWRFRVIRGEKLVEFGEFLANRYKATAQKYSERKYQGIKDKFLRSSCVIAIFLQRDPQKRIPEWEEIASTAMAVQNMWLTASEIGVGAYWSSPALINEVDKFFDMNDGERCIGFFYMGKYDGELPEGFRKSPISEKVEWIEK